MMKSKIHRAVVTHADLHYVGSITIDHDLMDKANLIGNEKVDVVNVNNGARFSTYVIPGRRNSGVIGVNGAAARLVSPGDHVIIIAYGLIPETNLPEFRPSVVFVDEKNRCAMAGDDVSAFPDSPNPHHLVRSPESEL